MLRLLFCLFLVVPTTVHALQPKLVLECSNLKGHNYMFPNFVQQEGGWTTDGLTGVRVGLWAKPSTAGDEDVDLFIQYHTTAQGWHFPNGYAGTVKLTGHPEGRILMVAYSDNTMEMYMFMLASRKVAVSLMRHGGLIESARLFVGDCTLMP